jgi:ABC-type nitrate/sulfonate/bicarbonate transport system ATPase subunit
LGALEATGVRKTSHRPPRRIRDEVKIELPRPRSLEIKKSLQCHEYRNYIWDLIRSESRSP